MNADQELIRAFRTERAPVLIGTSALSEKLGSTLIGVDDASGVVTLSFRPDQFFCQAMGVVQGGAVAAMLDFALAFAALSQVPEGHSVATVSLNVCLVRPVAPERLIAIGTVDRIGRSCVFARATLAREDGEIVATGASPLSIIVCNAELAVPPQCHPSAA